MKARPVTACLLLVCEDRPGLVAAVATFIHEHGGNILHADQHTDREEGVFLQRVEFDLSGLDLAREAILEAFAPIAERFAMRVRLHFSDERARVAILASRQRHCLYDLLARWRAGELPMALPLVISNHPDHAEVVAQAGVRYLHLPVTPETRAEQEDALLAALAEARVDLVVLARYMQILSPKVVRAYPGRILNIHHSFLPAFAGGRPYHQAHARGVKIIGATAHYVTEGLDEGPIIEQDVARVGHRDSVRALIRKGRDLETVVLARALALHLEHRVLTYGGRTVVFE